MYKKRSKLPNACCSRSLASLAYIPHPVTGITVTCWSQSPPGRDSHELSVASSPFLKPFFPLQGCLVLPPADNATLQYSELNMSKLKMSSCRRGTNFCNMTARAVDTHWRLSCPSRKHAHFQPVSQTHTVPERSRWDSHCVMMYPKVMSANAAFWN